MSLCVELADLLWLLLQELLEIHLLSRVRPVWLYNQVRVELFALALAIVGVFLYLTDPEFLPLLLQ